MGTNCHIAINVPDGDNICLMNAADIRWVSNDAELRLLLGIPDRNTDDAFWEHVNNDDYQRVLDAALVHKESLIKERDALHEASSHVFGVAAHDLGIDILTHDIDRTNEWIAYYEIAATLVKLGHSVICYGC